MKDITYCSNIDCIHRECHRHQFNAPKNTDISMADLNDGLCYTSKKAVEAIYTKDRERLRMAICRGTQKTNYKCDTVCKAMCGSDGVCAYCSIIADAIEEEFEKGF
jgi:hypothetical protein